HTVHGPQGLIEAMTQMHDMFSSITFEIEVGPIVEGDLVAGRWRGHGTRTDGESMAFVGNDMLRVADGTFVEYWVATHPV
ncbi:MAG: nuclear transport factor 2 family protein, partial [Ornithinimicrobium sp.]